jgi:hypothetical protein
VIVLIVLIVALGSGSNPPSHPSAATTPTTSATQQPVAQTSSPAAPALSPGDQAFVAAIRANLTRKGYSNSSPDSQIANVGNAICAVLRSGASHKLLAASLGSKPEQTVDMSGLREIALANKDICPGAHVKKPPSVTYIVTGSYANVTYGPAGSDFNGTVPMHVTRPLGNPSYYAINAQLQGGGTVSCKIEVNGKVISSATASGGYNIADCEISQDPFSGGWQNDNTG